MLVQVGAGQVRKPGLGGSPAGTTAQPVCPTPYRPMSTAPSGSLRYIMYGMSMFCITEGLPACSCCTCTNICPRVYAPRSNPQLYVPPGGHLQLPVRVSGTSDKQRSIESFLLLLQAMIRLLHTVDVFLSGVMICDLHNGR